MAAVSHKLFVFDNGRKIKESNVLEVLIRSVSITADGNNNGLTITESAGKFDLNGKILGNIGAGTAAGQAPATGTAGNWQSRRGSACGWRVGCSEPRW